MTTSITSDWVDLTQVDREPGLPPRRRRDWMIVEAHLDKLRPGQWALIEAPQTITRADGVRKVLGRHPRVQVAQRLQDDGTYLVFARIREGA